MHGKDRRHRKMLDRYEDLIQNSTHNATLIRRAGAGYDQVASDALIADLYVSASAANRSIEARSLSAEVTRARANRFSPVSCDQS